MVQEGHRIQRRGPGLNLKLQTLPGVPGVRAPLSAGSSAFCPAGFGRIG